MEFTGERYIPNIDSAEISYEHWHRYLYATLFVKGGVILDVACGEGYGSFLLAQHAKHVVGVDISAEAIRHASHTYVQENLQFKEGSLGSIPVGPDASFDGVVSFESIEHVDEEEQRAFLGEVKRILKPDGFFLISTPNKLAYSDIPAYTNEFHVKEFQVSEIRSFLEARFRYVKLIGQRIYPVSYLWNMQGGESPLVEFRIEFSESGFHPSEDEKVPLYVLALCSDKELGVLPQSVQVDLSGRLLVARDQQIQVLQSQMAEREHQVQTLTTQLASITASTAWKAALLAQRMRRMVAPDGSRRHRALQLLIKGQ